MENQPIIRPALRYGLLTAGALIAFSLLLYTTDLYKNQALTYVSFLLLAGGIGMACRDYLTVNRGFMSFGQGFKIGLIVTLIAGAVSAVFSFIYLSMNPGLMEGMLDLAREQMEKQAESNPAMTPEVIDQAFEVSKQFLSPVGASVISFLTYTFFGLIISLIVAAIMKKDNSGAGVEQIGS